MIFVGRLEFSVFSNVCRLWAPFNNLMKPKYFPLALLGVFAFVQSGFGSNAVLTDDTTYVFRQAKTTNSGSKPLLSVSSKQTALLKFDVGTVPEGTTSANIAKATLTLFADNVVLPGTLASGSLELRPVTGIWDELSDPTE